MELIDVLHSCTGQIPTSGAASVAGSGSHRRTAIERTKAAPPTDDRLRSLIEAFSEMAAHVHSSASEAAGGRAGDRAALGQQDHSPRLPSSAKLAGDDAHPLGCTAAGGAVGQ